MSINYDFYKRTGHLAEAGETHFVRPISRGVIETDEVAAGIERASSLTEADVKATLLAVADRLVRALHDGYTFHLEGVGYFSPRIDGEIARNAEGALRLRNAAVSGINFRPEKRLLAKMSGARFTSAEHAGRHSHPLTPDGLLDVARRLTADGNFFTPTQFSAAAGLTRTQAYTRLQRAEQDGLLRNIGTPYRKLYTLAD